MDTQPTKLVEDVLSDDIIRVQVCTTPDNNGFQLLSFVKPKQSQSNHLSQ